MSQREIHPNAALLERFMRNEAEPAEKRRVIRHLLAGCDECVEVTGKLWNLGESPGARLWPQRPAAPKLAAGAAPNRRVREPEAAGGEMPEEALGYGGIFERLSEMGRRLDREHAAAPQRVAELLARPPGERLALVRQEAGFLTAAVGELLLVLSRESAAAEPRKAMVLAELALAIGERLDAAVCGAPVAQGLKVRAWGYIGHARRLAGDLDGAEWALAMAESLAGGEEPIELAELLLIRAGLAADRGGLPEAEALLERVAELFGEAPAPRRMGCTLALLGLVRAERGDAAGAIAHLRSAVNLLDQPEHPADWRLTAAALCRLARLLAGGRAEADAPGAFDSPTRSRSAGVLPAADSAASSQEGRAPEDRAADGAAAEALEALGRALVLARGAADAAAEARVGHLRGQVEAASGREKEAEKTLRAAITALASLGLGREALLAQVELVQLLARQGRGADLLPVARQQEPRLQARDKSWTWYGARMLFEREVRGGPINVEMLTELGRYLAPGLRPTRFPAGVEYGEAGLGLVA
jgi:tetratricopeptide (TPR) repeat protein